MINVKLQFGSFKVYFFKNSKSKNFSNLEIFVKNIQNSNAIILSKKLNELSNFL